MSSKYTALATDAFQWRQRNARLTWAIIGALGLLLITVWFHDEALDRYYIKAELVDPAHTQSYKLEDVGDDIMSDSVDIAPQDLKRFVNRAEKLWSNNVKKRHDFIKEKGGLTVMREFSDKAVGTQYYTLVSSVN